MFSYFRGFFSTESTVQPTTAPMRMAARYITGLPMVGSTEGAVEGHSESACYGRADDAGGSIGAEMSNTKKLTQK